jgi:hypothetical protein
MIRASARCAPSALERTVPLCRKPFVDLFLLPSFLTIMDMHTKPSLKQQGSQRRRAYFAIIEGALIILVLSPVLVLLWHSPPGPERIRPIHPSGMEPAITKSVQAGMSPVKRRTTHKGLIDSTAIDICFDIERSLHTLVPYTTTRCIPFHDVSGLSFMVISAKPIFAIYGAKKAWLTGVVTMMGKALNDHQDLAVNHIWISDGTLMAKAQALALSGSIAKDLQGKANAHDISPEGLYLDVTDALRRHPIPPQWATAA